MFEVFVILLNLILYSMSGFGIFIICSLFYGIHLNKKRDEFEKEIENNCNSIQYCEDEISCPDDKIVKDDTLNENKKETNVMGEIITAELKKYLTSQKRKIEDHTDYNRLYDKIKNIIRCIENNDKRFFNKYIKYSNENFDKYSIICDIEDNEVRIIFDDEILLSTQIENNPIFDVNRNHISYIEINESFKYNCSELF